MGTNFYARPILTEEIKAKIDANIAAGKWDSDFDIDEPFISVSSIAKFMASGIHLCKRSAGWQFTFDHNWGKYYKPTRDSIHKFLSSNEYTIIDEYGATYSVDEFWHEVDMHNMNPYNSKKTDTVEFFNDGMAERCEELFGVICEGSTFSVDGLCFSTFTDFS